MLWHYIPSESEYSFSGATLLSEALMLIRSSGLALSSSSDSSAMPEKKRSYFSSRDYVIRTEEIQGLKKNHDKKNRLKKMCFFFGLSGFSRFLLKMWTIICFSHYIGH